ncbi:MAG TPA: hypothetical protein VE959_38450 [Bryobacteraceae bacterium]|nr:hypothetical protein [Bryobacteraceae bacterium]
MLLIDPQNPNTLYSANRSGGAVFKSTTGAASWSRVWSPADSGLTDYRHLASLVIDPQNPEALYVAAIGVVARSTNGGGSWAVVGSVSGALDLHGLVVDPQDSGTLYGLSNDGVEKSTDGGAAWNLALAGGAEWVAVAPAAGGASALYAGGDWRGVLKSTDGGVTWARKNSGLIATSIDSLAIDPLTPGILYAGINGAGLFKTTDGAASWSTAPSLGVFFAIAVDPRNEGTVYAWDGNGVRKSLDGGQSWVALSLGSDDAGGLAIDTQNPANVYYYYETGYGYKSADGGADWSELAGFPGFLSALAADPQNSGTVYAGSVAGTGGGQAWSMSSGVLKSTDGGQSWSGVNTLWQSVEVSNVFVDPSNSNIVYARITGLDCSEYSCGAYDYTAPDVVQVIGLYRSSDGGASWVKLDVPGGPYTRLLGIDRQGALYAWMWSQSQFARSQDGGATWNALATTGLPDQIMNLAIDRQDSNHLFAGTYGSGLFEIRLAP